MIDYGLMMKDRILINVLKKAGIKIQESKWENLGEEDKEADKVKELKFDYKEDCEEYLHKKKDKNVKTPDAKNEPEVDEYSKLASHGKIVKSAS